VVVPNESWSTKAVSDRLLVKTQDHLAICGADPGILVELVKSKLQAARVVVDVETTGRGYLTGVGVELVVWRRGVGFEASRSGVSSVPLPFRC
jgi:hypothetical protein